MCVYVSSFSFLVLPYHILSRDEAGWCSPCNVVLLSCFITLRECNGVKSAYPKDMPAEGMGGAEAPSSARPRMQKGREAGFCITGRNLLFGELESPPIIKADLRERMLPHGKENFEKK